MGGVSENNQQSRIAYSSSLRIASNRWRGMIRRFLLSRAALPASSRISADRYSSTAARYTKSSVMNDASFVRPSRQSRTWSTRADAFRVISLPEQSVQSTYGELQTRTRRARLLRGFLVVVVVFALATRFPAVPVRLGMSINRAWGYHERFAAFSFAWLGSFIKN